MDINIKYNNYYENVIENFKFFKNPCPKCGSNEYLIRYGFYLRNLCILDEDEFKNIKINIQRVYCKYCECTHAILPIEALPYCYYSLMCIFKILSKYYLEEDTIEEITENYDVTQIMIYIIIAKFKAFSKHIVDFLRIYLDIDIETDTTPKKLLELILKNFDSYSIIKPFFQHSKKIFLMTRSQNILSEEIYIEIYDYKKLIPT